MSTTNFIRRCASVNFQSLKRYGVAKNCRLNSNFSNICIKSNKYSKYCQPKVFLYPKYSSCNAVRLFSTDPSKPEISKDDEPKKLGLVARFKQMYKDYWYVLVPVHLITSAGWFGAFYYLAKSGVDIPGFLEQMGLSETITSHFKDSSMGFIAVAYGLYKIATPLRYTVTLTGTTFSINYLTKRGIIKPVPSKEQIKELYKEGKENMKNTFQEKKNEMILRKEYLKERRDNILSGYTTFRKELKDIKDKCAEAEKRKT